MNQVFPEPQGAYSVQVGGDHYRAMAIQPMQFSMANGLDACTHTAIKYLVRKKGDKAQRAEDLRKAIHCIQLLAQHEGIELGDTVQPASAPYIGPDRRKAAEPATTKQSSVADADGWIKWEGGECPVAHGTLVDVRHRSGFEAMRCRAGMLYATRLHWLNEGSDADIIAYRLSKEASHG